MSTNRSQQKAFQKVLFKLSRRQPDLYYRRTDFIAKAVYEFIHNSNEVDPDNAGILGDLSVEDIQYKLSFK